MRRGVDEPVPELGVRGECLQSHLDCAADADITRRSSTESWPSHVFPGRGRTRYTLKDDLVLSLAPEQIAGTGI